jgi:hypothetical protein
MTEEQILQLAKTCGFTIQDRWSAGNDDVYYECHECELLKFAREIYAKGQQEEIRRQKTGIGYVNGTLIVDEF